jgi:hypothetical protein
MSELHSYGLKKIEAGAIASDGDMGATLSDIGIIYKDTCDLQEEDGSTTEHYGEASDDPFLVIDKRGKMTLKFSLVDVTPDTLVKYLGGSVTTVSTKDQWNRPKTVPNIELSFKCTTQNDVTFSIPRGKVKAKINWKVAGLEVAKVDFTITALEPTKTGVASFMVNEPAA